MTEIYFCGADTAKSRLEGVLLKHIAAPIKILHAGNGKPYIKGNPVHFSLSHSGERAVIVLSDSPVGVDMEIFKGRDRASVLARFSPREQAEISDERDFLIHWTAREAYIKLYGLTLAKMLKRIEFFDKKLYVDGEVQSVNVEHFFLNYGIIAVCRED